MLKITNPATGKVIRELEEDKPASLAEKARAARRAQPEWARRPLTDRVSIVRRFGELLASHREELAALTTSEVGKPISQSRNEINGVKPRIDFFIENVASVLETKTVLADGANKLNERISLDPLGVVAHISPWNYPYFVGLNVIVPALLTGNAVLYKPSEFSTLTGLGIAKLLHEAGVPKDVLVPVVGGGAVGAALLEQAIDRVFITGSNATGRKVAELAAKRLIKVQLELGGKDPIYVCEDADVANAAAATADGAFYNTGQSCCSVERIYVHEKIYSRFVEEFTKTVKGFVVGEPTDDKTYIGPLTRGAQRDVLAAQIADAIAKGGKLLCGGKAMPGAGSFFEPTVVSDATHAMSLMRDESFGPVIGIAKVNDDEEAVRLMNDTEYGLTAGVYTPDEARASKILGQVNAGSVYWNCCDRVSPRLPWSGRGHSGIGCTLSTLGIQAFVQPKAWHLRGA